MIRSWFFLLPVLAVTLGLASLVRLSTADTAKETQAPAKSESIDEEEEDEVMLDPLGPNAACYVCHMTFVFEEIARTHLAEKITCIECHGLSAAHANDEDIGATKPDIMYTRDKVDAACQKCHEDHDVPAHEVVARFIERELKASKPICTDCHGMHRIEHAEEEPEASQPSATEPAPKAPEVKAPDA